MPVKAETTSAETTPTLLNCQLKPATASLLTCERVSSFKGIEIKPQKKAAITPPNPDPGQGLTNSIPKAPQTAQNKPPSGVEQWRSEVSKYDWPANDVLAIMNCESGGKADQLNNNPATGDYSVGLMQINLFGNLAKNRPSEKWLKNGKNNIKYAHDMYTWAGNSFGAWTCARKLGIR